MIEFLRQLQEDGSRFKHSRMGGGIQQGRNFRIGIQRDKATGELIALHNVHIVGIVFGARVTGRQQFFQQYGNLLTVGCSQRVQLEGMLSAGQMAVFAGSGSGTVNAAEFAAHGLFGSPDSGGDIILRGGWRRG